jgi:nucleotide-binding universal stress UspA family protein
MFKETIMMKILLPVDGSDNSARAVEHLMTLVAALREAEVHLINVQDPVSSLQTQECWTAEQCATLQQQAGDRALAAARRRLDAAGIAHTAEIATGPVAQFIVDFAREWQCDMIVMGTRGMGAIGNLLMGSVAAKVVHLTNVPVVLVK